jgi:fructokinase
MEAFDLVCFGEVLYDVYETKKVLAGAPLNTASFASFLGLKTALISAVGNNFGEIQEELTRRNVKPFLQRTEYLTGEATIHLSKNKIPTFNIDSNSAYDHIQETKNLLNLMKNTSFFYFGTLSQRHEDSKNTLMKLLSATAATVIYDVNLRKGIPRWEAIVKKSFEFSTILKMNEYESNKVKKVSGCKNMGQLLDKTSIGYVFVTLGEKGACLYQKDKEPIFVSAPNVNAIDTTGCGDAFTAAIIFGFRKKWSIFKILEFAVVFSSHVAQYRGAFDNAFLVESGILQG